MSFITNNFVIRDGCVFNRTGCSTYTVSDGNIFLDGMPMDMCVFDYDGVLVDTIDTYNEFWKALDINPDYTSMTTYEILEGNPDALEDLGLALKSRPALPLYSLFNKIDYNRRAIFSNSVFYPLGSACIVAGPTEIWINNTRTKHAKAMKPSPEAYEIIYNAIKKITNKEQPRILFFDDSPKNCIDFDNWKSILVNK